MSERCFCFKRLWDDGEPQHQPDCPNAIRPAPADTRQAMDAARRRILNMVGIYVMDGYLAFDVAVDAFGAAVEAWARADERARLRAEIGASSQDETANRP